MARHPRKLILDDGATFHITWQCHNRSFFLEQNWAKSLYYNLLLKNKKRFGVKIYSYCFMSSHPHLTGQCRTQHELSKFMQVVNTRFALAVNKFYHRVGQAIRDRFISPQVKDDESLRKVMAYIDLNPVRSKIVRKPGQYRFCSYRHYALGESDPLLDSCPAYEELGETPKQRQLRYQQMVEAVFQEKQHSRTDDYQKNCFIGDPDWVKARYEKILTHQRVLRLARLRAVGHMRR